ncbi:hypothetical protein ASPVEDRAFT_34370 [Aspergillus versicolor CBS 583.65]|uniref:Uncharacterized protein n=1 Tax=Aspergillus versicolor CBS 583.65 TaxID=1036611 RepID=A0A1L9Q372_ASPVE|nr:uncharacterized protein ASPVEDRAFT_34370 [Aspergillus versicolor CBS 583.65]OJJ08199.1 hypothetical protein ASPVEDRAFT_34370 [Aspergillus versicolor CBS 583.65]
MNDIRIFNTRTATILVVFEYETVYTFCRSRVPDDVPTEVRQHNAEAWLVGTPMPRNEQPWGPRPHAYRDWENLFETECASLADLRGDAYNPALRRQRPALWMYVGAPNFDYGDEDAEPGSSRIVTDRGRRMIGVAAHSNEEGAPFVRASEHQEVYAIHIIQIIVPHPPTVIDAA